MLKKSKANDGFSLVEILIAVGILVIGLTGILVLFPAGLFSTKKAIDETQATLIAESVYDSFSSSMQIFNAEPLTLSKGKFEFIYDGIPSGRKFVLPVLRSGNDVEFDANGLLQPLGLINADPSDDSTFIPGIDDSTERCQLGRGYNLDDPSTLPFNVTVSQEDNYLEQYSFNLEIKSPAPLPSEDGSPAPVMNISLYDIIIRIFRKDQLVYRVKTQVFISPPPGNP